MDFLIFFVCSAILVEGIRQTLKSCRDQDEVQGDLTTSLLGPLQQTEAGNEDPRAASSQPTKQMSVVGDRLSGGDEATVTLKSRKGENTTLRSDAQKVEGILESRNPKIPSRLKESNLKAKTETKEKGGVQRHQLAGLPKERPVNESRKKRHQMYGTETSAKIHPHAFSKNDIADEPSMQSNPKVPIPKDTIVCG